MWRRLRLSDWWVHLTGRTGAVIRTQREVCFVSDQSKKTPLVGADGLLMTSHTAWQITAKIYQTFTILSLNSKIIAGCFTWTSQLLHESTLEFANLRWTGEKLAEYRPRSVSHSGKYLWDVCWVLETRWTKHGVDKWTDFSFIFIFVKFLSFYL